MRKGNKIFQWWITIAAFVMFGCGDRTEDLKNGVIYATSALQQVSVNPMSRATWDSVVGRGGNAADYVKATLPKENPVFDSFEYAKPTHPWTIVIRPGTTENEFFIEGYGLSTKQPVQVEQVTLNLPEE